MSRKAAALYRTVNMGGRWTFRTVVGDLLPLSEDLYYLSYNDGRRHLDLSIPWAPIQTSP